MQKCESNAMDVLNTSISPVTENIDRYRKQTQDFPRKSKLPFEKLVKVMLNLQGNSLNAELQEAFPELSERMTASIYVQARDKLSLPVFEDLLSDYNQSAPQKLLNGKYRLYAIDGSDFTTPWNPQSAFERSTAIYDEKRSPMLGLSLSLYGRLFWCLSLMAFGTRKRPDQNLTPNLMTLLLRTLFVIKPNTCFR